MKKLIITLFLLVGFHLYANQTDGDLERLQQMKPAQLKHLSYTKGDKWLELLEFVKTKEGWRTDKYICPGGYPTVGYGFRTAFVPKEFHYNLSKADGDSILRSKLIANIKTVRKHYPLLNHYQQIAIASLIYAKGFGRIIGSKRFNIPTHKLHYQLKRGYIDYSTYIYFSKWEVERIHYRKARRFEYNLFNFKQ